jgi:hypothetical protein
MSCLTSVYRVLFHEVLWRDILRVRINITFDQRCRGFEVTTKLGLATEPIHLKFGETKTARHGCRMEILLFLHNFVLDVLRLLFYLFDHFLSEFVCECVSLHFSQRPILLNLSLLGTSVELTT